MKERDTHTNDGGSNKWHPTYSSHYNTQVTSQPQHWINRRNGPRSNDWTTWVKNAQPQPVNVGNYQSPHKEIYYHSPTAHNKPQQTAESTRPISRNINRVSGNKRPIVSRPLNPKGWKKDATHMAGEKKTPSSFTEEFGSSYVKALRRTDGQRNR